MTVLLRTPFSTDKLLFSHLEERGDQKFKIQWSKSAWLKILKGQQWRMLGFKSQVPAALMIPQFSVPPLNLAHCTLLVLLLQLLHPIALDLDLRHKQIKILRPWKTVRKRILPRSHDLTYQNGPCAFCWCVTNTHKKLCPTRLTFPNPLPFSKTLRIAEGREGVSTKL